MKRLTKIDPSYKELWKLALPIAISQLGQMTVALVDTAMVGNLGSIPLAAISLANSIFMFFGLFAIGLSLGLTPLVSKAFSRSDVASIRSFAKNSFTLNTVVAMLLGLIFLTLLHFLDYFDQDPAIIPLAQQFGYTLAASIVPMVWFITLRQLLEGLSNTKLAMVITIGGNLLNVGLNFVLIYGYLGAPAMGAVGAGVATLISRVIMFGVFVWVVRGDSVFGKYLSGFRLIPLSKLRIRRLLNIGSPISAQMGMEMMLFMAMALMIGSFGAASLAAHQIALNIPSMSFMVVIGVGGATTILVSRYYALRQYTMVRRVVRSALTTVTIFMTSTAILFLIFAHPIVSIFNGEPEVQQIATYLLFFGAMFQISDGIQGVMLGALRGTMDVKRPMIYAAVIYLGVGTPLAYLFSYQPFEMGPAGAWVAFVVSLTFLGALYLRRFNTQIRLKER